MWCEIRVHVFVIKCWAKFDYLNSIIKIWCIIKNVTEANKIRSLFFPQAKTLSFFFLFFSDFQTNTVSEGYISDTSTGVQCFKLYTYIDNPCERFWHMVLTGRPGARKIPGWLGKFTSSPEARKHFPKPGIFKTKTNCLNFMGILYKFPLIHVSRDMTKPTKWVCAQAELSLRWAHTHFVGFVMSRLMHMRQESADFARNGVLWRQVSKFKFAAWKKIFFTKMVTLL